MNPWLGRTLLVCAAAWLSSALGCANATVSGGPFTGADAGETPPFDPLRVITPVAPTDRVIVDPFEGSCSHTTVRAKSLPLDLVMMVDTSGSMNDLTASGESKWAAVKGAFYTFFHGSGAGLGVGMQFFPTFNSGVPATCTTDAACGTFGPCDHPKACSNTPSLVACQTPVDCPNGGNCVPLGQCSGAKLLCAPVGLSCGGTNGDCRAAAGQCAGRDQCQASAYETPAVPIGILPDAANLLLAAMGARSPDGSTPTGPALQGAILQAQARALAKPDRRVAVVLATDGFPTSCQPQSIGEIAALAAAAEMTTPPVPIFVIGVFTPAEESDARSNLNAIAAAGGSERAFIVNTGSNVGQAFLEALTDIRAAAIACEYPLPTDGVAKIDFGQVNVLYTSSRNQTSTIGAVANPAACDAQKGGWYYDQDPASGTAPTLITACPATCARLRADPRGRVDLVFGCKTVLVE